MIRDTIGFTLFMAAMLYGVPMIIYAVTGEKLEF